MRGGVPVLKRCSRRPDNDAAAQKGAGCDDDRPNRMARADRGRNRADRAVFGFHRNDFVLHELQALLLFERMLHIRSVLHAVSLRAQ